MSPDDSQTWQQTRVQWRQCQCYLVCPCVHSEQLEVIHSSMFSGDAVMRRCQTHNIDRWRITTACMFHANFMHYTESDYQKLGGAIHCWSPSQKVEGDLQCLPRSPRLLRLWQQLLLFQVFLFVLLLSTWCLIRPVLKIKLVGIVKAFFITDRMPFCRRANSAKPRNGMSAQTKSNDLWVLFHGCGTRRKRFWRLMAKHFVFVGISVY